MPSEMSTVNFMAIWVACRLTHDTHALSCVRSMLGKGAMTPPGQLPPIAELETAPDFLEPLEQRVTIYTRGLVWDRIQATWVRVFRAPSAQYADAFHIQFK